MVKFDNAVNAPLLDVNAFDDDVMLSRFANARPLSNVSVMLVAFVVPSGNVTVMSYWSVSPTAFVVSEGFVSAFATAGPPMVTVAGSLAVYGLVSPGPLPSPVRSTPNGLFVVPAASADPGKLCHAICPVFVIVLLATADVAIVTVKVNSLY